ncbi:unnamed protein product [Echinostoma caproni]|uniref:C2H2-type domain-containing protein n=1 Tax=Echinostoma caproni TaxID=27848 RepID=A0A183BCW0_9TREM|nr:unnamed protein product [Echinostoma caproni]
MPALDGPDVDQQQILSSQDAKDQRIGSNTSYNLSQCSTVPIDESVGGTEACNKSENTVNEDTFFPAAWDSETISSNGGVAPTPGCLNKSAGEAGLTSPIKHPDDGNCLRGTPISSTIRGDINENLMDISDRSGTRTSVDPEGPGALCDSLAAEKLNSPLKSDESKDIPRPDATIKKQSPKIPRSTSPPQVHRCGLCGKDYRHAASLRNHMRKHSSGALASKRYRCTHCMYSSQYNRNVLKHFEAVHQNPDTFFPGNASIPNSSSYPDGSIVSNTNPTYWNATNVNEHLYKSSESITQYCAPTPCFYKQQTVRDNYEKFEQASVPLQNTENAPLEAYQQISLDGMVSKQEPSNSLYYCNVVGCGKPFKSRKCLATHVNEFHREVRFKCPVDGCHFTGLRQEHLKRHVNQYHIGSVVSQANDHNARFHSNKIPDTLVNEPPGDKRYEGRGDRSHQRSGDTPIGPVDTIRSGPATQVATGCSASHITSGCAIRADSPSSYKKPEMSHFDPSNQYESGMSQDQKPSENWISGTTCSFDGKSLTIRPDSMVRSTVEQLLCAPDPVDTSLGQFFQESSDADLAATEDFRPVSRDSPVNDFTDGLQRFSFPNTKENANTPLEFDSPPNPNEPADSLPESFYQKHVNSETDAFFTDLQEILARDMPSIENSTPKANELPNGNPSSVGLKEDGSRSVEMSHSKSPFTGLGAKPVCTASMMSGDSGLESWSSSSSCSAGPNSSSVWGTQEGTGHPKLSPGSSTPQPASVPCPGLQDPGTATTYDGYPDGQVLEESPVASSALNDHRRLPDSNRVPSRSCDAASEGSGNHLPAFTSNVNSGTGDSRPLVSSTMQQVHSSSRSKLLIYAISTLLVTSK